jgi:nicotinate-nucleotide adenylyltransferase
VVASGEIQQIGLFGGTFDPVHAGHLTLARHVLDCCRLDSLLFIPAPQPPHKGQPAVSFSHRAAMLAAALAECPDRQRLHLSLIEQELPTPSYTINTVEALIQRYGRNRYFLIIGADSLLDLPHWHRAVELLAHVSLIVVKRDTIGMSAIQQALSALDPSFAFDPHQGKWMSKGGSTVEYLADVELPISSSAIRDNLQDGKVPSLLPPAVFAYIQQHALYGWRPSP